VAKLTACSPFAADPADDFGLSFELVIGILQTLDQITDTTERLKAMDSVVAAVKTHSQLKHQLQLDDVLPRYATHIRLLDLNTSPLLRPPDHSADAASFPNVVS
jgi:hypothetical protein